MKLVPRFTKWRAVYLIGNNYPSKLSIKSNAHALARYAALVQEANGPYCGARSINGWIPQH